VIRRVLLAAALALLAQPAWADDPCCGPITAEGEKLAAFLDGTGVDHLWVSGWRVDWRTGEADRSKPGGPESHTHCSAFVAAIAERKDIYILRPPEHSQELLASAQMRWLTLLGAQHGWALVSGEKEAQGLANRGYFVVASYENPDLHQPGHIAIVRPSLKSAAGFAADGPQITQAGGHNYISTTLQTGFRSRRPQVLFFGHEMPIP
jgi:hypothetical protein